MSLKTDRNAMLPSIAVFKDARDFINLKYKIKGGGGQITYFEARAI